MSKPTPGPTPRVPGAPRPKPMTDRAALNQIAEMLRAPEWRSAADYLEWIAEIVAKTGRDLDAPPKGAGVE